MSPIRPVLATERRAFRTMLDAYLVEDYAVSDPEGKHDPSVFPNFELYWTEPWRSPWWLLCGGQVAGLALVSDRYAPSGLPVDHGLVEFYVAPPFRRTGVGSRGATALFTAMPGQWELAVSPLNPRSTAFWPRAIAAAGGRRHETRELAEAVSHRFIIG
jgi:predicted acetyltransferase